ncbi:cytochrome o ubiquinol oxidase subunit IV [Vibrio sp. ER1A]|uniref:cytochrome o ubiquinol oxidase subunit IV n=1 Tax=Vibrio sp. ER1A TaxID=1517681 RepID=UPI0004DCF973|nr:cytochrome o ubiquinol oxidase subunit IV [Vibrio sp. ER1A]KFA98722.1 cytochrome O ubiquinol oxidase [Vibrio sp. ER1A]
MSSNTDIAASDYIKGFCAALVLTVVPFYLVWAQSLPASTTYSVLFACAIVQVFVHFKYFLHMEAKTSDGQWNLVSLLFTIVVVFILIAGSLWIMYNMNMNMMM